MKTITATIKTDSSTQHSGCSGLTVYYADLVREYENSRTKLYTRIDRLSEIINSEEGNTPENNKRRHNLYMDAWHIDQSIKDMREYIRRIMLRRK